MSASLDRVVFHDDGDVGLSVYGANGTGSLKVSVTDSVADNSGAGFVVQSDTGQSNSELDVTSSFLGRPEMASAASKPTGNSAALVLAQSKVTGNATGYNAGGGGFIHTYGDNYINSNTANSGALSTDLSRQ